MGRKRNAFSSTASTTTLASPLRALTGKDILVQFNQIAVIRQHWHKHLILILQLNLSLTLMHISSKTVKIKNKDLNYLLCFSNNAKIQLHVPVFTHAKQLKGFFFFFLPFLLSYVGLVTRWIFIFLPLTILPTTSSVKCT